MVERFFLLKFLKYLEHVLHQHLLYDMCGWFFHQLPLLCHLQIHTHLVYQYESLLEYQSYLQHSVQNQLLQEWNPNLHVVLTHMLLLLSAVASVARQVPWVFAASAHHVQSMLWQGC